MSSAITNSGEALLALKQNQEQALVIDTFILANVGGVDPAADVDRTGGKPDAGDIVLEYTIPDENKGYINPNQVVYSMLLGSDIGDFTFNWVGLYSSVEETVVAIAYTPELSKWKTAIPVMGNSLTRNFMLEYSGIKNTTQITVEASTWQIDFTARFKGIDERERLSNSDLYGTACFFGDAWLVVNDEGSYSLEPGIGYVEGVRIGLESTQNITPSVPCDVFLDVALQPQNSDRIAMASVVYADPGNYVDDCNDAHYSQQIASINEAGVVTDLRPTIPASLVALIATLSSDFNSFSDHLADTDNPHGLTLAQLGLGYSVLAEANGYYILPGGLVLQWGKIGGVNNSSATTVTLPMAMPTACLFAMGSDFSVTGTTDAIGTSIISSTQISLWADCAITNAWWLAIGH